MTQHYIFDLPRIITYLRALVRRANKQELAAKTGIPYTRLIYFARSAESTPNPSDITALMKHYMTGYSFSVTPVSVVELMTAPQGEIAGTNQGDGIAQTIAA